MPRVEELQEIERLTAAYLTEDDPVRAVAKSCQVVTQGDYERVVGKPEVARLLPVIHEELLSVRIRPISGFAHDCYAAT